MADVRVRFAPSPTGALHIGGARTALFNWLFARKHQGKFILRLEDTDTDRSTRESSQGIFEGLKWLKLDWDEGPSKEGGYGPYQQSERLNIYRHYLENLLANGQAYYCFCSPAELEKERAEAKNIKNDYKYSGHCRNLSNAEISQRLAAGEKPVIRFKANVCGNTVVDDLIRGKVTFDNSLFDDFIIAKSDGWPTYNFAVVVDDHEMKISHVIRAEEHLSNTPKQIQIYHALGWDLPVFAHVSMILAPDRHKLSKRHGATSVQEFRDNGYLPEAMINYLALLGWSSGDDTDFFTIAELKELFSLDGISKSPAIYDLEKLCWMNGHYLSVTDTYAIVKLLEPEARRLGYLNNDNLDYFSQVVSLVKNRVKTVNQILDESTYFFTPVNSYDDKGVKKHFCNDDTIAILKEALSFCSNIEHFTRVDLEQDLRQRADELEIKAARLIHPIRLALSGRTATPGIFELMELLGREQCIERIKSAIIYIETFAPEK